MSKTLLILDYSVDGKSGANISRWFDPPVKVVRVTPDSVFPELSPTDHTAVIHSGSALSIVEDSVFTPGAVKFVKDCSQTGVPQMGICYGHQLLARAFCGPSGVGRADSVEIGWLPVNFLPQWPVEGLTGMKKVWQSHYDCVKMLPESSVVTVTNSHTEIQAFVNMEKKLFGTQFHPEFDRQTGNQCFSNDPEIFSRNGISLEDTIAGGPDFNTGKVIFGHFLKTFEQEM